MVKLPPCRPRQYAIYGHLLSFPVSTIHQGYLKFVKIDLAISCQQFL